MPTGLYFCLIDWYFSSSILVIKFLTTELNVQTVAVIATPLAPEL